MANIRHLRINEQIKHTVALYFSNTKVVDGHIVTVTKVDSKKAMAMVDIYYSVLPEYHDIAKLNQIILKHKASVKKFIAVKLAAVKRMPYTFYL